MKTPAISVRALAGRVPPTCKKPAAGKQTGIPVFLFQDHVLLYGKYPVRAALAIGWDQRA